MPHVNWLTFLVVAVLFCATLVRSALGFGEALIAVTNEPKLTLDEIRDAIKAKGLTNLSVPREIKVVKEIPKLGTGKVNHRELQALMESPPFLASTPAVSHATRTPSGLLRLPGFGLSITMPCCRSFSTSFSSTVSGSLAKLAMTAA
jgi:hypothetical protein